MKNGRRVLVIEDDPDIAGLVELHLRDLNCVTEIAGDGDRGLERAEAGDYDLVVLDLMLPGLDGLEICKRIRAGSRGNVPILMLTAKSTELDRILGLEVGADDYLPKPFNILELVARAKAFDLLFHFASRPGMVFTRSQLLDEVWGYTHEGSEHMVNSHINRLRARTEPDPAKPRFIETVWGVGDRFPGTDETEGR